MNTPTYKQLEDTDEFFSEPYDPSEAGIRKRVNDYRLAEMARYRSLRVNTTPAEITTVTASIDELFKPRP